MNKQAMIEVLNAEGRKFHPEHGVRRGLERAVELIDKELRPLVVPKHVGDLLDKLSLGYEQGLFSMILELKDMWIKEGYVGFINDNKKELIEVILGDRKYKVEDEKLYHIKFSEHQYAQWFDEDSGDLMMVNSEAFAGVFSEEDINKINPQLMTLAVEVTI